MSDLAVQNRESEQEVMPSFDFLLERETERNTLLAEHRAWLKEIKRERPLPKTHYRVAVYIRYFNQTRYEDYLSAHKKQFLDTLALCPNWKFVGFYVDEGSTAPNMESAPEWSRLLQDCYDEKVDLIITQKASNKQTDGSTRNRPFVILSWKGKGGAHILYRSPAETILPGQLFPVSGYCFADLLCSLFRFLRGKAEIIGYFQSQFQVNGVIILTHIEGKPVPRGDWVHIIERGQPPAGGCQKETMVAQVVVSIGYRHAEHDPLPQLGQILSGRCPVGTDKRRQIQVTAPVRCRGPISLTQ